MEKKITITAPGRICLFGDHQDYLGLPVIACAIDRQVTLTAELNTTNQFHLHLPDINAERRISITETFDTLEKGDHYASSLRVLRRYGCEPDNGYNITIRSTIPINAGTSSSSAIVVAWIHFLLKAFGSQQKITPQLIAHLAYEAEVLEHQSPGGKMDQFTISLGNIIHIDTNAVFGVTTIGTKMEGLILGESGIPKETIGLLGNLRGNAERAIAEVKDQVPHFSLKDTVPEHVPEFLEMISEELRPYFYAAIHNHHVTQQALFQFQQKKVDHVEIGKWMMAHHEVLRNQLKLTVPLIDTMIDAALKVGAYGAKIVGSGGGGSIVTLAPKGREEEIIKAIKLAGAKDAYVVNVTEGTKELE